MRIELKMWGKGSPSRLTQTFLQQVNANKEFRPIAEALGQIRYTSCRN